MISIEELKELKELSNYNLSQAEKDFYQNTILFCIYKEYGKEIIFKGGTALTKCYGLDRFSEDLDFTITKEIDLIPTLQKWLKKLQINYEIKEIKNDNNSQKIKIKIEGALYNGNNISKCSIRIDISKREKIIMEPTIKTIKTINPKIPTFDVVVMNKQEIAAEKIRAIMTRNQARDVYDYHELGIKPKIELINEKLKYYKKKFSFKEFEEAIEEKRKIWNGELENLILHVPKFDIVKKTILRTII